MARGDSYQLQGQQGGIVIAAGENANGNFRWIQMITDTVLDALTAPNLLNADPSLLDITIPAGIGIGGKITSITVLTGIVIAYYE